jgi:YD repeat-containing protein
MGSQAAAFGEAATPVVGADGSSSLVGPLVVPGMQMLDGDQQGLNAEQAQRDSSAAFSARVRSRTQFAHVDTARAARVAREAFPGLVEKHDGGAPELPAGEQIVDYKTQNVAQLSLPDRRRAVVESIGPMAMRTSSGKLQPIDLALKASGASFVPAASQVAVQIPKRLSSGVHDPQSDVSLTPVDAQGVALGGSEGSLQGASVLYANTQTDTDTLAKPTSVGFELSSILRSEDSPHELYYRVGLPSGARLVQHDHRGPLQVLMGGEMLGMVMPPSAVDAAGTSVPVSMSLKGDLLAVNVGAGEYQYPLDIDPEYLTAEDRSLTGGVFPVEPYRGGTEWLPFYSAGFTEEHTYTKSYRCGTETYWCEQSWYIEPNKEYNAGEFTGLRYKTQGESTVYNVEMWLEGENEPSETTTEVEYNYGPNEEGVDNHVVLSGGLKQERYKFEPLSMTSGYFHNPLETPRGNDVRLIDYTTQHESGYGFWTWLWDARVYVAQEESKHPETEPTSVCPECGFNTSSPTITTKAGTRSNVLYGSGSWLGPVQGAYHITAHDPGIGVSFVALTGEGDGYHPQWIRNEEGLCLGIQCHPTYESAETYNSTMPNGEHSVELYAEDAAGLYGLSYHTIKVDATPPEGIGFTGMPEEGAEISATSHTLTVHATDGKAPTPSSGVKTIAVSLDEGPQTQISGNCSPGPCTASGQYKLNAEAMSEGVHSLTITATDFAGNISPAKEILFDVRHGSPVSIGPGAVDPTTGQFMLSADDVSLGGASGVQRSYQSRNLTAGASGPFGSQWAMSVGGGEGLRVLPSGSVVLTSGTGGTTTFTLNKKGELEAPTGDESLKIEDKAPEHKYILRDITAGSETVFEQPTGTQSTPATYGSSFGAETGVLSQPVSAALDAGGDVWVSDWANNRIAKFSKTGALIATYGTEGSEDSQFNKPWGIAVNQTTGNLYVTDTDNNRIEELSPSGAFIAAIGWGVSNGEAKLETCTSSCEAGIPGTGAGQFYEPQGISIDSSGDLWVAEYGSNRIQEFSEAGSYIRAFGSVGTGAGQFEGPMNIAFAGGDVYVTDQRNNRLDEFTTSGGFLKTIGWGVSNGEAKLETCSSGCRAGTAGTGSGQFDEPRGLATESASGNLYVTDMSNDRVQEITTAGAFVSKFGSAGAGPGQFSAPMGVVVSPTGTIYVTDFSNARVQEWTRALWWPTSAKGALPGETTYIYAPVEGNEGSTTMQPHEVISSPPAGVECGTKVEELKDGCRAITFKYATETTATGENRSKWGEYKGHLSQVLFHAYNSTGKAMEEKAVAQYAYDKQGRLRAEWDPRVEKSTGCGGSCSALKTTYGYDSEGHVTALTPPGQESWAFTYGAIAGDPSAARLLKVARAPASASLWTGEAVENSAVPTLSSTSPVVGTTISVSSNGTWTNGPIAFGYQWDDCTGTQCAAIPGAINHTYTPQVSDAGYKLVVQVTATNGDGSAVASSASTSAVPISAPKYSLAFGSSGSGAGQTKEPMTAAIDSSGNVWVADNANNRIDKFTSAGTFIETFGFGVSNGKAEFETCTSSCQAGIAGSGNGQFSGPWGIAINQAEKDVYVSDQGNSRVEELTTAGAFVRTFGGAGTAPGQFGVVAGIGIDPGGNVWVADYSNNRIEEFTSTGVFIRAVGSAGSGNGQFSGPGGFAFVGGNMYVADFGNKRIQEFSLSGVYLGQFASVGEPYDIYENQVTGEIYETDLTGKVDEFNQAGTLVGSFGTKGTGSGQFERPTGLVVNASGDVYVADHGLNRLEEWTPTYSTNNPPPEPPSAGSNSVSTVEYHVPLSGTGLPTMSKEEVEKWGQKDRGESEDNDPVEGMAIFPPDEPQGWPASGYKRATLDYFTAKGLTVNTVSPGGGISTTEYNANNETVRTLNADNRATALVEGCKSISKKECKSGEVSEELDTKTEYNSAHNEIVKVVGPAHEIKLATGAEVRARAVSHNYYDEGAKEAEEKNHEVYNLVTRSTSGALLSGGEEMDVRTTVSAYNGQEGLGWKLRKPTSTTIEPAGLDLTKTMIYNEKTGDIVEAKSPGSDSETVYPPVYSSIFGSPGSGKGQLNYPVAMALDASANVWVDDTYNDRIEKWSSTGSFVAEYGSKGAGNDQFAEPGGIAVAQSSGDVYVSDTENNRVEELGPSGTFIRTFGTEGSGKLLQPVGIAVDSTGDIWVADTGHNRIVEFSATGVFLQEIGSYGTGNGQLNGPVDIAISEGSLYVVDSGNDRIEQFSPTGSYLRQFGGKGAKPGQFDEPFGIAANPTSGDIFVSDVGSHRTQEFSPAGRFLCEWSQWSGSHELAGPMGLAVGASGKIYMANEESSVISEWLPPEAGGAHLSYATQIGSSGSGNGQLKDPVGSAIDGNGNVWVTDSGNNRIEEFSSAGKFVAKYGKEGTGSGEFKGPQGIDVNQSTGNVYVSDSGNNRIEELSGTGTFIRTFGTSGSGQLDEPIGIKIDSSGNVWVADVNNNRIVEFSSTGTYIAAYGSEGSGDGQFEGPVGITFSGPNLYVVDIGNHRVEELSATGAYVGQFGIEGGGDGEFYEPIGIASDSAGNVYVTDGRSDRVQEFSAAGAFRATFAYEGRGEGQLTYPTGISINAAGDMYVVDTGDNRIQEWIPINEAAHNTKTIYYTSGTEAEVMSCRNHPEWASLPCRVEPDAQPSRGLPELPVTTIASYNIWDEAATTEEKFGTGSKVVTRTKVETYDAAGRAQTSEETASPATDAAVPKVTVEYNSASGAIEKESTPEGTIKSKYDTVGQLTEYSDASGNITKHSYEEGGDGRLTETSEGKGEEAKSTQTYSYNAASGLMEKLVDSAVGMTLAQGTFTASYDVEGKMTSEVYPNGMCANTAYNSVGAATSIEYIKTRNCAEKGAPVWFSDSVVPGVRGEALEQTSTLSKESYAYDNTGRLLEAQETPAGEGCTTRLYAYDEESNRTSETIRKPGTEGKCATEGGAVERHTYDEANRLADEGVEYETFGNITKLPAADAGTGEGAHELKSTYYLDGQVATQEQSKGLTGYKYDPAGRTLEEASENTETKAKTTIISHYAGSGEALTWTSEGTEKWTRRIPGIDGALDAVQESGKAPVLQLHDLQGNVVGTVGDSESETKLLSTYNSTEFGVPKEGKAPPKYAWLGASGLSTETSFGSGVSTQGGATYVPQVARSLQTAPVIPPGAFPNGQPGTQETATVSPGELVAAGERAAQIWEQTEAERQKAREREAAEALQKCREEGGCGAEVPGEETFGDPIHCYVGGEIVNENGYVMISGYGGCNQGLPEGTWLKTCVMDLPDIGNTPFVRCDQIVVENHTSRYWSKSIGATEHCSEGDLLRGYVAFYVPGGRTLYAGIEQSECGGNDESVWETLSPWQALPIDL